MASSWPWWADLGQLEAPHLLPCPWNIHYAHCSCSQSSFKEQWVVEIMWWYTWLSSVKGSISTSKILSGKGENLLILWHHELTLKFKFPCFLALPPTNLNCSSLSEYQGQFWISAQRSWKDFIRWLTQPMWGHTFSMYVQFYPCEAGVKNPNFTGGCENYMRKKKSMPHSH